MIFVTVGNALQGFRRFLDKVDALAGEGVFGDTPIFIQSGHNPGFKPRFCTERPFISMDEFNELMKRASLVMCHGGCTVLTAIRLGMMPVVMPRMTRYGEHVNDHQVEFVRSLASEGRLIPAYEPEELGPAVSRALANPRQPVPLPESQMVELIGQAVRELIGDPAL
jgi:UDP-N-acetylglucosamine transferase subunit ALG13